MTNKIYTGSEKEFENIVNRNKLIVYSTVMAYLHNGGEVDDIVQETFIYAYYNYQSLRENNKLTSWLCAIARNKAKKYYQTANKTVSLDEFSEKSDTNSTEDNFMEAYQRTEIINEVYKLSNKYRETILLYYIAEKSIKEIAEILSIPEGTVRSRLTESRKKLKKGLVGIMSTEKNNIINNELYEKVQNNINKAYEYSKNNQKKEASELCDETIKMISEYSSFTNGDENNPLKLLYNLYHAKAFSLEYVTEKEKQLEYLKKALELVEKSGDFKWLAKEYINYGINISNAGKTTEASEYYAKAIETAAKADDKVLLAEAMYWQANSFYGSNEREKALEQFSKIVDLKDELLANQRNVWLYGLANGSYKILNSAKSKGHLEDICEFQSTLPGIRYTENKAVLHGEPGYSDPGGYRIKPIVDIFVVISKLDDILRNDFVNGYTEEKDRFSYSYNPVKTKLEVLSTDEKIVVSGETFSECIHIQYTDTVTDGADDTSWQANLNRKISGIVNAWFAPDIGVVKITKEHTYSNEVGGFSIELSSYNINNKGETELRKKYLPLAVGNIWKYETFREDGSPLSDTFEYENVFEVEYASDEYNYISNWGYAYKK